jgi:hypothetical protein
MAGYSATPLEKKLGIKPAFAVAFVNAPENFARQLNLPAGVNLKSISKSKELDFIHVFVKSQKALATAFEYSRRMKPSGMLWISWPKKTSGVATDVNENIVRETGLAAGLVDVKICAVDEIWSGLKFVYRLRDRPKMKSNPK